MAVDHRLFQSRPLTDGSGDDFLGLILVLVTVTLIAWLQYRRRGRATGRYYPDLAWLRGGIYFCCCFILSWATGVLPHLLDSPLIRPGQLSDPWWIAMTLICAGVIINSYFSLWPRGTVSHGRPRVVWTQLLFGIVWGVSEAQLMLSFWALSEIVGLRGLWAGLSTYLACSVFTGNWHRFYWDIHVAPDHNIREWNLKKVLWAHNPNLILTLVWLGLFGNAGLFVLLQATGLAASTWFMRFPPWWYPDTPQHDPMGLPQKKILDN